MLVIIYDIAICLVANLITDLIIWYVKKFFNK